jgi:hypothetical protein
MKEAKSKDGILSYLTKKHGGNVCQKFIVTITSKSTYDLPQCARGTNLADLNADSYVWSKDEPGQWVCWDFRDMRVRPTHYTIDAGPLKSWVVEGSLDGEGWTEIDRQTSNRDFNDFNVKYGWKAASFAVSTPAECRFIRLAQTDKRYDGDDSLALSAVEFFGTLSE